MTQQKLSLALLTTLTLSTLAFADEKSEIAELKKQIQELQETTQALIEETSNLQSGFNYTTVDESKRVTGLGAAASKVYYSQSPLSIGGYGEMYYSSTNKQNTPTASKTEVKRLITYFGYKFNDSIILNTEIEYEGGGVTVDGAGDEVVVEFMYIDFLLNTNINLRAGNMLVPIGLINQQHEPTLFTTVQRPKTSYYILPTTWGESGLLLYGDIYEGVEYKAGVITALQVDDTAGDKWLRKGRGGSFAVANPKAAGIFRLDYTAINGLLVGASAYSDDTLLMLDAHFDYKIDALRVYGTYAEVSRSQTLQGSSEVQNAFGSYINASYDLLSFTTIEKKLPLFIQYEVYNPQAKRADGTSADTIRDTTVGLNFFPHEQVVIKTEYLSSKSAAIESNTASISLGFIF